MLETFGVMRVRPGIGKSFLYGVNLLKEAVR